MEKRCDFIQIERQMQEFWEREQVYRFDKDADGKIYSMHGEIESGRRSFYTRSLSIRFGS